MKVVHLVLLLATTLIFVGVFNTANAAMYSMPKNMKAVKAGDDVYIVFQATNKTSNEDDIYLTSSHDGGKKYTTINLSNGKALLNESGPVDLKASFNPQVAVDKEGDAYVAWNANSSGGQQYIVLDISKDKFATPGIPVVNMTSMNGNKPASEPLLIKDETSGAINLYYLAGPDGPQDPCKTRCG